MVFAIIVIARIYHPGRKVTWKGTSMWERGTAPLSHMPTEEIFPWRH